MEKNPSQSHSHVRTSKRYKPYVRWDKETDVWTAKAIEETYIEEIKENMKSEVNND